MLGKMNSFPLRLECVLVFLIYQMQDTRRKIGSKLHGKKLMINREFKKVLPYALKRYCLISSYLFSMKNKNIFSSHTPSFSSLSIIFVYAFSIWWGDKLVFKCEHFTQNWVTNLKRRI